MPLTVPAHTIEYNGLPLTPGETFTPFPDEHPGYTVVFVGVIEDRLHLRDDKRAFSCPLSDIADAVPTGL